MRNLILLFLKYGSFFLFIMLEVFSFYLIIQHNEAQREIYISSVNNLTGYLDARVASTTRYLQLDAINDSLAMENALLRARFDNLAAQIGQPNVDSILTDSSFEAVYAFHPARVVNNSITRTNNYLTIDKGSRDGVSPHMGVIAGNGIVGIVRSVSSRYALVMSVLHQSVRIPASILGTSHFGPLTWNSRDPSRMTLEDVPKHALLSRGDTITTSGYSRLFPAEMPVGTIDTFWIEGGSNFYQIQVKLFADLASVKYVYVVEHTAQQEITSLEEEVANE